MKIFNRTYLPETITYNGSVYKMEQSSANENSSRYDVMDLMCKGKKCIRVNVLSRKLKGKTDFFGQPYRPTTWIFTNIK